MQNLYNSFHFICTKRNFYNFLGLCLVISKRYSKFEDKMKGPSKTNGQIIQKPLFDLQPMIIKLFFCFLKFIKLDQMLLEL